MKRTICIFLIIALALSGCMLKKQDVSGSKSSGNFHQALIPVMDEVVRTEENAKNDTAEDKSTASAEINADKNDAENVDDKTDNDDEEKNNPITESVDEENSGNIDNTDYGTGDDVKDNDSLATEAWNYAEDNNIDTKTGDETEQNSINDKDADKTDSSSAETAKTEESKPQIEYASSTHTQDFYMADDLVPEDDEEFARLAPTTTMEFAELVGDNGIYEYPKGYPEPDTYRITVDLYHQVVMVFSQDENGDYTVPVRYMLCSSGADTSQSPIGIFKMKAYRVRYSIFKNTTSYAQYWSLITGRIYFHSILYDDRDASTYTESYKNLGSNCSHGCIRLTVPDARWIWYHCAPDTEVEIRKGAKKDKQTVAIRKRLILAEYPAERLKLVAGKTPLTDNWKVEDIPNDIIFVQGHQ